MTKKQKDRVNNIFQLALKITATSFVFIGFTLALGIKNNAHIEIYSYLCLFIGVLLYIIHSYRSNDHMLLLVSVAGFTLVGNLFLDTETANMIANSYGIALTEDQGWFAQYGSLLISILKELV
jgi:uncharacterized protein with PQ loop repeat|tara:strand:+ start:77 stop:445 length:369 start_codon:yes stop_codon:yes gene_type:complete